MTLSEQIKKLEADAIKYYLAEEWLLLVIVWEKLNLLDSMESDIQRGWLGLIELRNDDD